MMKALNTFIPAQFLPSDLHELMIADLSLDSRMVQPNSLFFACAGTHQHGNAFIPQAIENGAVLICSDKPAEQDYEVPYLEIPKLRDSLSEIAKQFYDAQNWQVPLIGVTGTNGKSSVTHFIAQLAQVLAKKAAVIGTIGNGFLEALEESGLTTPDIFSLFKTIRKLQADQAELIAMEVSSHALDQKRVEGLPFKCAVFTNLSRDHLDYHNTMAAYAAAKFKLFHMPGIEQAVLNMDAAVSLSLLEQIPSHIRISGYSLQGHRFAGITFHQQVVLLDKKVQSQGTLLDLNINQETHQVLLPLFGDFNIENALAALTSVLSMGYPLPELLHALTTLKPVRGRFESIRYPNKPTVIIDYAHTPDALENVLQAARGINEGKLICVFGCGGDRDRGKRALMAQAAAKYADKIYVTTDNPRSESPERIIEDILEGLPDNIPVVTQVCRETAISQAIQVAETDDVLVIAGKGHENYQEINQVRHPFCDRRIAESALQELTPCF